MAALRNVTAAMLAGALCAPGYAVGPHDTYGVGVEEQADVEDPPEWREGEVAIPAYPKDKDLRPVEVDVGRALYRYAIDITTLSVGAEDDVIRYTVVVSSTTGAKNVFYEGLRCGGRMYKTYAFGGQRGPLRPNRDPSWKRAPREGPMGFRDILARDYFCNPYDLPRKLKQIIQRVKTSGGPVFGEEEGYL